jgi:hypothetical protein
VRRPSVTSRYSPEVETNPKMISEGAKFALASRRLKNGPGVFGQPAGGQSANRLQTGLTMPRALPECDHLIPVCRSCGR